MPSWNQLQEGKGAAGYVGGKISDVGSLKPGEVKKDREDVAGEG